MITRIVLTVGTLLGVQAAEAALQKEIFGMSAAGTRIMRYDVIGGTFLDCGAIATPVFSTNLAMDNNRRLYYMNPFEGLHTIWQADLDSGNQLINQQVLDTLQPGLDVIDGFTIGPDQNLYMTGYGHSEIYRYNIGSFSGMVSTEVTLVGTGEFRSDLAFDPLTGDLVGIGIVPDGSGRRSLFQIPGSIATNGVNDNYTWDYYGGASSPWAALDLRHFLGANPDGVAFDPTNGDLFLSGDGEAFSSWDRSTATLLSYLPSGGPDTGLGFDLAFQTVPEPGTLLLLGLGGLMTCGRRR